MEEALNSLLHRSKNELDKAARKQAKLENAKLPKKPRIEKRSVSFFFLVLATCFQKNRLKERFYILEL